MLVLRVQVVMVGPLERMRFEQRFEGLQQDSELGYISREFHED